MATPQENLANAEARAQMYRDKGDATRAATWDASADRYRRIIEIQQNLSASKARLEAIKERISTPPPPPPPPAPVSTFPSVSRPSDNGSGYTTSPNYTVSPAPVPPVPSVEVKPVVVAPPPPPVKTAPIDTILYNEENQPVEVMADIIFENIGGQEIINIARNDTINGQSVVYQPIKNLTQIQQQYNPNNIVSLQATSDKYFQNFAIKFDDKVPEIGNGPDGAHVYIDPNTGDLVIEAINLQPDEQIELEITTSGTIYEAEL